MGTHYEPTMKLRWYWTSIHCLPILQQWWRLPDDGSDHLNKPIGEWRALPIEFPD